MTVRPRLLLDTNVLSDVVRGDERVRDRLRGTPPREVAISTLTLMEMEYGLLLAPERAPRLRPAIDALVAAATVLPFDAADARASGAVRVELRRRGTPIGPYDALLAGMARARGLTLVTANLGEFSRVTGLAIESWRSAFHARAPTLVV